MRKLESSIAIAIAIDYVAAESYSALFLPGGHGTMFDLPQSAPLARLLPPARANGKILAAVCHGHAGLLNVVDADGKPVVSGRKITAFSNSEEEAAGLTDAMPFLLESRMRSLGAHYASARDFQAHAIQDGNLVTGQNPASSDDVARLTLAAIRHG